MKPIQNPPPQDIGPNSDREVIANLQEALLFLLERERLHLASDERAHLIRDRDHHVYRDGTSRAVIAFREQFGLEPGEIVDKPTGEALNEVLRELGVFEPHPASHAERILAGQVVQDDESLFNGRVILFQESNVGSIRLAEDTTDLEDRYTITYAVAVDKIKLRVAAFEAASTTRLVMTAEAPHQSAGGFNPSLHTSFRRGLTR
jgi:hypothetical protein